MSSQRNLNNRLFGYLSVSLGTFRQSIRIREINLDFFQELGCRSMAIEFFGSPETQLSQVLLFYDNYKIANEFLKVLI